MTLTCSLCGHRADANAMIHSRDARIVLCQNEKDCRERRGAQVVDLARQILAIGGQA